MAAIKKILLLALIFFTFGVNSKTDLNSKINEKTPETIFLRKVENAVRVHDADQLLAFMEPNYKRSQHDEFLAGNTEQFLNEFFCSEIIFYEITEVSLIKYSLMKSSKTDYEVVFFLKSQKTEVLCTFFMTKNLNTTIFSIYSAVG